MKDDAVQDDHRRAGRPDGGELKIGETVQLAYMDQHRTLNPDNTAWQEISKGEAIVMVGKKETGSRA